MAKLNINIKNKIIAIVEYNSDKDIDLMSGAIIKEPSSSMATNIKTLRDAYTTTNSSGQITTTTNIHFKSESACASFLYGCSKDGKAFFRNLLGTTEDSSNTTNTATESTTETPTEPVKELTEDEIKNNLAKSIITFCKDFQFVPDNRCLNTMLYTEDVKNYILSFMELTNYPQDLLDDASSKLDSREWQEIMNNLQKLPKKTQINHRLIIKYGEAGTGKTTSAEYEYPDAVKIVASASADPDDLFTRFEPSKKDYVLTELGEAMVNGKPIIIDEGNLYPIVSLQRLQGCLDNTNSIIDRGIEIKIADGFQVIVTMNLETNLGKTPLPNPLVSRAKKIENFNISSNRNFAWVW